MRGCVNRGSNPCGDASSETPAPRMSCELMVKHWWQAPPHKQRAQPLKLLLLARGNQRIIVINTPWYL